MIFEAKYDPEYSAFGTFRPHGTSDAAWKNMTHLPTVFAEAEPDQEDALDVFDNVSLSGFPIGQVDAACVLETVWQF